MRHIEEWLRTSPKQERWGVLPRSLDPAPGLLCFYWQKSRSWRLCACGWHLQHPNMRPLRKRMQSSQEMSHEFFMNFPLAEIPQEERIAPAEWSESNKNIQELNKTPILPYMNLSWLPRHRFKLCNLFPSIPQSSMLLSFALPGFPSKTRL